LQDPNQSNVDNLNNFRKFQEHKEGTLKNKIDELEINITIKYVRDLYRSIRDFKKV